MSSTFESLAIARYPLNSGDSLRQVTERRKDYIHALQECKTNPAYSIALPIGGTHPCLSEPWMEDDTKGWQKTRRNTHHS